MIYLPPQPLSGRADTWLRRWQSAVDAKPTYADRVAEAKRVWPKSNKTFDEVRGVLKGMVSGHVRCAYCEDSCADEIDHIQPKDLYPELVFAWENYLFACGKCNGEKRSDYAVFSRSAGPAWTDVKRGPGSPIVPPLGGDPVLINPLFENPLYFLVLDLRETFEFSASLPWLTDREKERGKYTIDTLGLNVRDELRDGRRDAFTSYKNNLHRYIALKSKPADKKECDNCIAALQKSPHATVWHEMKRWHLRFPGSLPYKIDALFEAAPEALSW